MNFFPLDKPFAIFTNACFSVDAYFQMVETSRLLTVSTGGTHLTLNLDGEILPYFSLLASSGITQQKAGVSAW